MVLSSKQAFWDKIVVCFLLMSMFIIVMPSMLTHFSHFGRVLADSPVLIGLILPFLFFKKNKKAEN